MTLVGIVFVVCVKIGPEQGRSNQGHDVTGPLQDRPLFRVLFNASDRRQKKMAGVLTKRMATWMLPDSISSRLRT